MELNIFDNKEELGKAAAIKAATLLREAIVKKGKARFIAASGASQFEFLKYLVNEPKIAWNKCTMFHLDEYVGLPPTHPASFRKYMQERIIAQVHPGVVNLVLGDASNPKKECQRIGKLISAAPIDVAFVGIGENGHIAFNDPPADFQTEEPYIVVNLDEKCRKQQVGEGWFKTVDEVPKQAISMSIQQIMKSENIVCVIPDLRKAEAVKNCLSPKVKPSPQYPGSILSTHKHTFVYLDKDSSSMLPNSKIQQT
jgi:glucosamine-6-phosphate deaminase